MSGYRNIPIMESDKDKTALITCRGCFRHNVVLLVGCTTARLVFQRLMDFLLCGLTLVTCLVPVYLNDIIVYANDFEMQLSRVREVFTRLQERFTISLTFVAAGFIMKLPITTNVA